MLVSVCYCFMIHRTLCEGFRGIFCSCKKNNSDATGCAFSGKAAAEYCVQIRWDCIHFGRRETEEKEEEWCHLQCLFNKERNEEFRQQLQLQLEHPKEVMQHQQQNGPPIKEYYSNMTTGYMLASLFKDLYKQIRSTIHHSRNTFKVRSTVYKSSNLEGIIEKSSYFEYSDFG